MSKEQEAGPQAGEGVTCGRAYFSQGGQGRPLWMRRRQPVSWGKGIPGRGRCLCKGLEAERAGEFEK